MNVELDVDSPEPKDFFSNFTYTGGLFRDNGPRWDMRDWFRSCISCSLDIGDKSPDDNLERWLKNYRVLYLTLGGAKISGINVVQKCWRDADYFGLEKMGPWYEMAQKKPAEAVVFHEICWNLLSQQFQGNIDLDRPFEVCRVIPTYGRQDVHLEERKALPVKELIIPSIGEDEKPPEPSKKRTRDPILDPSSDCFRLLPTETRAHIAANLSTLDFF
ncbi:hypothetical protein N7540_012548 [Penicillium herquei]|nr:hypothetical protein N7540_012548 [Penicillium herquei]